MPAQKPGAVLAHGHSWFRCSVFLASLQLHSVTMESKAWPSGSVALGTKLRFNTTACPRCLHSPLWLGQHFALPPTLCPRDWPAVLPEPEQQEATLQPSLGFGMWGGMGGLEEIGGWRESDWCFAWDLLEDRVYSQLSRFPKPSLPSCP